MAHIVLLTGLPGIGKTTVATALQGPFYERLHFGGLLRTVVERRQERSISHDFFREHYYELIDSDVVVAASILASEYAAETSAEVCVLDSHAVSKMPIGLRVTPDDNRRMRILNIRLIVHLRLAGCVSRVLANSGSEGRQSLNEIDAVEAEHLQLATNVVYASGYDCPVMLVLADGSIEETVRNVDAAVRNGLRWR